MKDLLKLITVVSERDFMQAGAEVVTREKDAKLSGLIYSLTLAPDEEYPGLDTQSGSVD